MSSEHAVEQVPLAEIQECNTIQDPRSGQWITVTRTAEGTTSVIHKYSDGERTATQEDRVSVHNPDLDRDAFVRTAHLVLRELLSNGTTAAPPR